MRIASLPILFLLAFCNQLVAQQNNYFRDNADSPVIQYAGEQQPTALLRGSNNSRSGAVQVPTDNQTSYFESSNGRVLIFNDDQNGNAGSNNLTLETAQAAAGNGGGESDGGGNGTNPAQNITTFIVSNEFYGLNGGNQINTTYTRLKFPVYEKRGAFLLEVPYVFYDFTDQFPASPQLGGLGDIKIQFSYNTFVSCNKKFTMLNIFEAFIPSADTALLATAPGQNELTAFNLGTGKYVMGTGIGFVYAPQPNFIIAPLYLYEASVAGDDARPEIRRGKWRIFAMYAFENGAYLLPEFQVLTNYLSGNNDIYIAPEVGYSSKGTTLYVKPGFGIDPDINDREWGFEVGARIAF